MARKRTRSRSRSRRRTKSGRSRRAGQRRTATRQWVRKNFGQVGIYSQNFTNIDEQPGNFPTYQLGVAISQGDALGQRDGDRIQYKAFSVQHTIRNNITNRRLFFRFMLLQNKLPQEIVTDGLFQGEGATSEPLNYQAGPVSEIIKPLNRTKYKVLFDKVVTIGPQTANDGRRSTRLLRFYIPIRKILKYQVAATGPDTAVVPNIKWCWYHASDNSDVTHIPNGVYHNRVYREFYNK